MLEKRAENDPSKGPGGAAEVGVEDGAEGGGNTFVEWPLTVFPGGGVGSGTEYGAGPICWRYRTEKALESLRECWK